MSCHRLLQKEGSSQVCIYMYTVHTGPCPTGFRTFLALISRIWQLPRIHADVNDVNVKKLNWSMQIILLGLWLIVKCIDCQIYWPKFKCWTNEKLSFFCYPFVQSTICRISLPVFEIQQSHAHTPIAAPDAEGFSDTGCLLALQWQLHCYQFCV